MRSSHAALGLGLLSALSALPACEKPKQFKTSVEIVKIRRFGQDAAKTGGVTEMELKFADCPGEVHKVLRADKSFSECGARFKRGDKVPADVTLTYSRERGLYRDEVVRLDDCALKIDPKDEANYDLVQQCRPVIATGMDVGIHCARQRSPELIAKCPWLRRR